MRKLISVGACLVFLSLTGTAGAGTITVSGGAVKALTNISQVLGAIGTGNFDEGPTSGAVPLNVYSAQGLTWMTGAFTTLFPGIQPACGQAYNPVYSSDPYFPAPIAGGGTHTGANTYFAGVATFAAGVVVTQVGLTASTNGQQWLTAWDKSYTLIGQVSWQPSGDSAFVGIDTLGVPIGVITYGNHDIWNNGLKNGCYDVGGATIIDDSWIWASGKCQNSAQCNDGNPCHTPVCNAASQCQQTNNTAPCNDGNPCTLNDSCSGGTCAPGTPVTCAALDQCHTAGVCNAATGTCSNPSKADGSACNDNNGCTQTDTCMGGQCVGGTPVTCTAMDQCHTAGACNPATGICSNPNKADGSACSDTNACTQTDTCQNGVCSGMNPVMCAAPNQCQNAGSCDMTTGMCNNTNKPDGTACDDNNPCTQSDTCMGGQCVSGNPVTCTAMDQCHDVGMCDTTTGQCSNPAKADGASCDDGDVCTTSDKCLGGTCTGDPMSCMQADACHAIGTCDPQTGTCSSPNAPDGTACPGGTCMGGACVAGGTGGSTTTTTTTMGTGGSSPTGGSGTGAGTTAQSSGCKCGAADSAAGGTPAAALLMLLALRRRRTAAQARR